MKKSAKHPPDFTGDMSEPQPSMLQAHSWVRLGSCMALAVHRLPRVRLAIVLSAWLCWFMPLAMATAGLPHDADLIRRIVAGQSSPAIDAAMKQLDESVRRNDRSAQLQALATLYEAVTFDDQDIRTRIAFV